MKDRGCVFIMALLAFILILAGCNFPTQQPADNSTFVSTGTAIVSSPPASNPAPYSALGNSQRPLVFFGPLPDSYNGSQDFMDLFSEQAPWRKAAGHIQVFELNGGWIAHFPWEPPEATDEKLQTIIADLSRRGMAIGFEASPLVATDDCGRGVEGFFGPEEGLRIVNKLKQLGANVSYVSLDEPFAFGHIYDGPNACHWTPEKIAQQVQEYIRVIKGVYPDAVVGDIEPLWAGMDVQELVGWLDTYKAVTGSNFPTFDLDPDYSRADWSLAARRIEDAVRSQGIEFGIFYIGDAGDATDAEWLDKAFERARQYELVAGGKPDRVKFQSWHDHPDYVLPETKSDTFTALINSYSRTRTALSLDLSPADSEGVPDASGMLTDANGAPLPNAMIEITATALDGPGLVGEYALSGTVPVNATQGVVGFRVNTECGCQGVSDFTLYRIGYVEGQESTSRVPNGDFAQKLSKWGPWGKGAIRLEASDQDNGRMLHVQTLPGQDAAINSEPFTVTPGSTYTVTFEARISPKSFGSGFFVLVLLGPQGEISRQRIQLASIAVPLARATTGAQGQYQITLESLSGENSLVEANYAGDDQYWPAYASIKRLP